MRLPRPLLLVLQLSEPRTTFSSSVVGFATVRTLASAIVTSEVDGTIFASIHRRDVRGVLAGDLLELHRWPDEAFGVDVGDQED